MNDYKKNIILNFIEKKEYIDSNIISLESRGILKSRLQNIGSLYIEILNSTPAFIEEIIELKKNITQLSKGKDFSFELLEIFFKYLKFKKLENVIIKTFIKNSLITFVNDFKQEVLIYRELINGLEQKKDYYDILIDNKLETGAYESFQKNQEFITKMLDENFRKELGIKIKDSLIFEKYFQSKKFDSYETYVKKECDNRLKKIELYSDYKNDEFVYKKLLDKIMVLLENWIYKLETNLKLVKYHFGIETYKCSENLLKYLNSRTIIPFQIRYLIYEDEEYYKDYEHEFIRLKRKKESKDDIKKKIDLLIENMDYSKVCNVYIIESLESLIDIYLNYFLENGIKISLCKHCGKFYIPYVRDNQKYCSDCKKIGAEKTSREEIKKSKILTMVKQFRNRLYNRIKREKNWKKRENLKEILKDFNENFSKIYKDYNKEENKYTEESILEWLSNYIKDFEIKVSKNK